MARVKAEYKLDKKWKSKVVNIEIPRNEHGFTLTETLCRNVEEILKGIISPNIILRKVQILST